MGGTKEELCRLILDDVTVLRANLDRIWSTTQTLPPGETGTELENVYVWRK